MLRVLAALCLIASAATAQQPPAATITLPPTDKTLGEALASIQAQSGLTLTTTLDLKSKLRLERSAGALWPLLTEVATASGGRLTVSQKGRAVTIAPVVETGTEPEAEPRLLPSIDGAFRVVAKQVTSRRDLDTGLSVTDVTLDIHWDPRLPVFRIDSEPSGAVSFERKREQFPYNQLTPSAGKSAVSGSAFTSVRRLPAIPRSAAAKGVADQIHPIDSFSLAGQFAVTAAAKMLQFRVADTTKPTTLTQEGVTFTLQTPRKVGDRWDVPIELVYPPSKVEFESFEAGVWLSSNKLQLIDPAGKPFDPMNEDFRAAAGKSSLVYRFPAAQVPADRAGWSLVYETPSPLVEFDVAFTLSNIPLP